MEGGRLTWTNVNWNSACGPPWSTPLLIRWTASWPPAARKRELSENDFAVAREIVAWKHKVLAAWPAVKIVDVQRARVGDKPIFIGRSYHFELSLDLAGLAPEDVGAELVVARPVEPNRAVEVIRTEPLSQVQVSGEQVTFALDYVPEQAGMFDMALRIFPQHPMLPHRMDFALVKWA